MNYKAKTDEQLSISSQEFLWTEAGHPEVHEYLIGPILNILHKFNVSSILDIGCGNGSFDSLLAIYGFKVVGFDYSISGLNIAKKQSSNLCFFEHDITTPLPEEHIGRYDAVISLEVIEHLMFPRELLKNAIKALQPKGIFILSTPFHGYWKNLALALFNKFDDHWHPLRDHGHVKFFSKRTICSLFSEFAFSQINFTRIGRVPFIARSMIVSGVKLK